MAGRLAEAGGVLTAVGPDAVVLVGRHGLFTPTQAGAGLAAAGFAPLVHLDIADEAQSFGADGPTGVRDGAADGGVAGDVDQGAVIGGLDRFGGDLDHHAGAFVQGAFGLDRAALVPAEQDDAGQDGYDAGDHAPEGRTETREPARAGRLGEMVAHSQPSPGFGET